MEITPGSEVGFQGLSSFCSGALFYNFSKALRVQKAFCKTAVSTIEKFEGGSESAPENCL